jgi:hypothetical protein
LVTINDLLRLISRDNLAIYQDFLPNDGVEWYYHSSALSFFGNF